ncbi:helix-turn-helix domain-containing protein [Schinkia azotoformans]|uniref:helix-turn-helix domain-containing protein n=1 Tax=Schinkia azotoformans TaxID=1454 RepID=UPI002DBA5DFF|nr:helix-turn-helix transcriptional regulator [Schinkia azotoformans]MEC1714769.1 helix-turn-helix transcriptional regulator [Schinkia azotoformans]MEC1757475.1 helix-turn-helix transcriptional regulator [Schinkia azotoformans]
MKVSTKLDHLLDAKNMSRRELARLTETRPQTINDIANNEIKRLPLDVLGKICEVLSCEITDVIELVPDK